MGMDSGGRASGLHAVEARPLLTVEKIARWPGAEADAGLSETFGHDYELLVGGVNSGALELWKCFGGKSWAVTRVEPAAGTLTCCCYQGIEARQWMGWLMEQGRRMGLKAIVFYTKHRGLQRMFRDYGFVEQETVYRAPVQ